MNILRTLIVEDQPSIRRDIIFLLANRSNIKVVGETGSVAEAIDLVKKSAPDLLILDVHLEDGTGFDLLKQLGTLRCKVVFLTAHAQYALEAFRYDAIDYILKPVDEKDLLRMLDKVAASFPFPNNHDFIVLSSSEYLQIVKLTDIVFCKGDNGYTTVYLADGRKVITAVHLKYYEDTLPAYKFVRPHKSYLVNYEFIDRYYKSGNLFLKDGTEIPVADRRKDYIKEHIRRL